VLADVAGKGMSAALLMSNLQARVQILAEEPTGLDRFMARLDQALARHCPSNRFITMFMALIDPQSGAMPYCNAGHNPALLVRATGQVERLEAGGTVLGMLPELGYTESKAHLEEGDLLAVYSDGVTESTNPGGEEFGEGRLAELLVQQRGLPAAQVIDGVLGALAEWTEAAPAEDDLTLVVARRPSAG
jgi:serine phosphatase RsbU (regulator of sigma subunit)